MTASPPNIANTVRAIVVLTDAARHAGRSRCRPACACCATTICWRRRDDDYEWPQFDENTASALCYTSGTTGRPKGVLYSHRSTVLHAYAIALPDVLDMRATSRILPVVPMFHVNAWGIPYAAALTGATLVLPGRHLDGAEPDAPDQPGARHHELPACRRCGSACCSTLRTSGEQLTTVKRMMIGGSACAAAADRGVRATN